MSPSHLSQNLLHKHARILLRDLFKRKLTTYILPPNINHLRSKFSWLWDQWTWQGINNINTLIDYHTCDANYIAWFWNAISLSGSIFSEDYKLYIPRPPCVKDIAFCNKNNEGISKTHCWAGNGRKTTWLILFCKGLQIQTENGVLGFLTRTT